MTEIVEEIKRKLTDYRLVVNDASVNASILALEVDNAKKAVKRSKERWEIIRLRYMQLEDRIDTALANRIRN